MAGEKKSEFVFENNSLDWCRLFAAVQIAVSHFLALMLISYQEPGMLDVRLWSVRKMFTVFPGLILLFSISGFLMGHSLESGSDRKRFLRRRLLRVYPGLWANVAVTAVLIVGILRPSAENLKSLIVWAWPTRRIFLKGWGQEALTVRFGRSWWKCSFICCFFFSGIFGGKGNEASGSSAFVCPRREICFAGSSRRRCRRMPRFFWNGAVCPIWSGSWEGFVCISIGSASWGG